MPATGGVFVAKRFCEKLRLCIVFGLSRDFPDLCPGTKFAKIPGSRDPGLSGKKQTIFVICHVLVVYKRKSARTLVEF